MKIKVERVVYNLLLGGGYKTTFYYYYYDYFCYKRVQTPGMSPPRAGAWTYCLFTPVTFYITLRCIYYIETLLKQL